MLLFSFDALSLCIYCYKLTNLEGSLVGVTSSKGCLFCEEQLGTRGPETGVRPVPPSMRESKLNIPVDGVCMATPLISVGGLLSLTFKPKFCAKFRGTVGNELGRCFELGFVNGALSDGLLEYMEPKLTGAVVTMGVFSEAEAAAKEADRVATFGKGGGIMGLLLVKINLFGECGPS